MKAKRPKRDYSGETKSELENASCPKRVQIKKEKSPEEVIELSIKEAADQLKRALEEGRIPSGEPFWDSRGRIEGILWKPGDKPIYKKKILRVLAEATKRGTPLGTSQIAKSVGLHILGCAQLLKELDVEGKISTEQRDRKISQISAWTKRRNEKRGERICR